MSAAIRKSTNRSLVIIDEIAQGTSPIDGSAIFISCMEHWMKQRAQSPLVLVATHLLSASMYLSKMSCALHTRFLSMSYTCQDDHIVFLYQPCDSISDTNFSFSVASAIGLPAHLIGRGQEVWQLFSCCDMGIIKYSFLGI